MMIRTSNYKSFQSDLFKTISISGDKGKSAGYSKQSYGSLAPKLSFWTQWHNNIGIVPEKENNKYYIQEYYKQVLSKLDIMKVYDDLDNSILLCYEDNNDFCHRHIVAAWFELFLGIEVKESIADGFNIIDASRPDYIKPMLESVIKENVDMRGFTSLRALYLFEQAEYFEEYANKREEETGKSFDGYRQKACYLRCDADEEEAEYRAKNKTR